VLGTRLLVPRQRRRGGSRPDHDSARHLGSDAAARTERHEVAVDEEPVKEAVRSYMSAYAPFYDRQGRFVGVIGVDM